MAMLQGNTYSMPIQIRDNAGEVVRGEQVERGEFVFGDLVKFYGVGGDVVWDESRGAFILPLTEDETFAFKGVVEYQGRVLLKDGSVSGSVPKGEYVYDSIGKTVLSDGGVGESDGEILTIELLERVANTGITEEVDPTVPEYVKAISEQDIANWNKVKNLGHVYKAKGSVQTYADLPTNNEVGDVWNVIEAYESYGAGTNFVWTADGEWDALSGLASFSGDGYVSTEEFNNILKSTFVSIGQGAEAKNYHGNIAIGTNSLASSGGSIVIGSNSHSKGQNGIAIGSRAYANNTGAIQLGKGGNNTDNTLQVFDDNIYNHETHTLTVQNIELNGVDLGTQLGDLNTALEAILGV